MRWTTLILLSCWFTLHAQEPEASDSVMTVELGEIVVTASRSGTDLLLVPMAVSVLGSEDLISSRAVGLGDLLQTIPGVLVQSRSGSQDARLTIRGFGARGNGDRSNSATIRGIKVLVDGVPETEPDGRTALDLLDLSNVGRVEIVRSNASTLFGNASGGVINLETTASFPEPAVHVGTAIGSYGLRRGNIAVGIPMEGGNASVSLTSSSLAGWRPNSAQSSVLGRATLRTVMGNRTRLTLIASAASNRFDIPGPLTEAAFRTDPSQANAIYQARRERRENTLGRLSIQLAHTLDDGHTVEALGFFNPKVLQRSERNTFRDFSRFHLGGGLLSTWKLERPFLKSILLGIDGTVQDGTILFYNLRNGERGDSLRTNKREGAESFGAFAQVTVGILPDLTASVGGRFDVQIYRSAVFAAGSLADTRNDRMTFRHFTPRAGVLYRVSPQHSLYMNFGGGLEVPAFNEVDPPSSLPGVDLNPFLKPMTSTTIELGAKGRGRSSSSFVPAYSYSLAMYRIAIRNEIIPFSGGAWFFSAGASRRLGLEIGGSAEWPFGLSFRAAFTLMDAKHESYQNDIADYSGNRVAGIPQTMLSARARYTTNRVFIEIGHERLGSYYADDPNQIRVASFALWNLTVGHSFDLSWGSGSVFGGVQNLSNEKYVGSSFINPSGPSSSAAYIEPGLPRNFYSGIDLQIVL